MADYKAMYLTMFRASEAALSLLIGCCGDEAALQKAVNTLAAAQQGVRICTWKAKQRTRECPLFF